MLLDPMVYLGIPLRNAKGKIVAIQIVYDDETVNVAENPELITIQTKVLLENL